MISRTDHWFGTGNISKFKEEIIGKANAFAKSKGMVAIGLVSNETPMMVFSHTASFSYQFKLVDPSSHEAMNGGPLVPIAPVQQFKTENTVQTKDTTPKPTADMYSELIKLDELHKKGILTDAEFEEQKKKILSSY